MLGDSCERLAEIPDDSIDLSVCSPPFASVVHVQPEPARPGELLDARRVPGALRLHHPRAAAGHEAGPERLHPRPAGHHPKTVEGFIGLTDFRGEVIRAFQDAGWIFYGEVTIWKNPQAQAIRDQGARADVPARTGTRRASGPRSPTTC